MKKSGIRRAKYVVRRYLGLLVATAAVLITAVLASSAFASGFAIPDQDSAAMSMGGAFAAQADNPSAVWYNPAGLTQLDGTRVSAGVIAVYPVMEHDNTSGSTDVSKRKVFLPPQLFETNKISDKLFFGFGLNSPFGLSTDWPASSTTSGVATFSRIQTIQLNPNLAYRINDKLSVAAGIDYIRLEATLESLLPLPGNPIFRLDGDGSGWGANAGVKLQASDAVDLGLSYRSRIKVKVDSATADVTALSLSNPVSTDITLPDVLQAGAVFKLSDKLTLNTDVDYTWWSTYDKLVLKSNTISALTLGATDTSIDEKDWKNTWTFRVGGQYKMTEQWKLRAGLVYDQNPVPSNRFETRVPDSDREGVTLGTGYSTGNLTADVSYMYLHFKNRTITNSIAGHPDGSAPITSLDGTYKAQAHLLGLTLAYKF